MALIQDVADEVVRGFEMLRSDAGATEFCNGSLESNKIAGLEAKLLQEHPEWSALDEEDREFAIRNHPEYRDTAVLVEQSIVAAEKARAGAEVITKALCRLTPDTFPAEEESAAHMYDFLKRVSHAYGTKGKQRAAGPIIEYLFNTGYDHTLWLWQQWIAACIAVGDYYAADDLLKVITPRSPGDCEVAPTAAHRFAKWGGRLKPVIMVDHAMIYLHRDGDIELASEIANNARLAFGWSREAVGCYRAISRLKHEIDSGRISIETKSGKTRFRLLAKEVPPVAVLTGNWGLGDDEEGQEVVENDRDSA